MFSMDFSLFRMSHPLAATLLHSSKAVPVQQQTSAQITDAKPSFFFPGRVSLRDSTPYDKLKHTAGYPTFSCHIHNYILSL